MTEGVLVMEKYVIRMFRLPLDMTSGVLGVIECVDTEEKRISVDRGIVGCFEQ